MPFIGTQPEVGGYSVLDALTASATASYTLQLNSANFTPSSANQLLVSLNGVIQKRLVLHLLYLVALLHFQVH